MNNSIIKNFGKALVKLLFFLAACLIIIIYYWSVKSNQQYRDFISFEETILYPKFDELNNSIYQTLPTPDDVKETKKFNGGGVPQHGRAFVIFYEYSGESQNIANFYNEFLTQNGWNLYHSYDGANNVSLFFHKGTACINFILSRDSKKYFLSIFHDYFEQSFSLKIEEIPSMDYILMKEFGETFFEDCPRDFT